MNLELPSAYNMYVIRRKKIPASDIGRQILKLHSVESHELIFEVQFGWQGTGNFVRVPEEYLADGGWYDVTSLVNAVSHFIPTEDEEALMFKSEAAKAMRNYLDNVNQFEVPKSEVTSTPVFLGSVEQGGHISLSMDVYQPVAFDENGWGITLYGDTRDYMVSRTYEIRIIRIPEGTMRWYDSQRIIEECEKKLQGDITSAKSMVSKFVERSELSKNRAGAIAGQSRLDRARELQLGN